MPEYALGYLKIQESQLKDRDHYSQSGILGVPGKFQRCDGISN